MKHLTRVVVALLAFATSVPLLIGTTAPTIAEGWRDSDDEKSDGPLLDAFLDRLRVRGDLRDLLVDRVRTRRDVRDLLEDRASGRQRLRERLRGRLADMRDDDDGDDDGGGLRGRLRERIAERRHGREGDCYFLTRSLRDADGDLLVIVRRRLCRD
jgi:hypothetical protein